MSTTNNPAQLSEPLLDEPAHGATERSYTGFQSKALGRISVRSQELEHHKLVEKRVVYTTELFFDLVFITAVGGLNEGLEDSLSYEEYIQFFFTLWFFWQNNTYYSSLFGDDDIFHKLYYYLYGLCIVAMAMHCRVDPELVEEGVKHPAWESSNAILFAWSVIACKGICVLTYLRTFYGLYMSATSEGSEKSHTISDTEANALFKVAALSIRDLIIAAVWVASTQCEVDDRGTYFIVGTALELVLLCIHVAVTRAWGDKKVLIPPVDYLNERVEGFLIIALGFTILGLSNTPENAENPEFARSVCVGMLFIFFMKLLMFDVEVVEEENHAMLANDVWGFIWLVSSGVICCGLSLLGGGIGGTVELIVEGNHEVGRAMQSMALGLAISLVMVTFNRETHESDIEDFYGATFLYYTQIITQFAIGALVPVLVFYRHVDADVLLTWSLVLLVVLVVLNLLDEIVEIFREKGYCAGICADPKLENLLTEVNDAAEQASSSERPPREEEAAPRPQQRVTRDEVPARQRPTEKVSKQVKFSDALDTFDMDCAFGRTQEARTEAGHARKLSLQPLNEGLAEAEGNGKRVHYQEDSDELKERARKAREHVLGDPGAELQERQSTHLHGWVSGGFFQGVSIRSDELIEQGLAEIRAVANTELFFDLVFASCVTRLNDHLKENELSFSEYAQYFTATWFFWLSNTYYSSIFGNDDLAHKIFYAVYSMMIALMTIYQEGGWNGEWATQYGYSAGSLRLVTFAIYIRCYMYLAKKFSDEDSEEGNLLSENEQKAMRKMKFFILRDLVGGLFWFFGAQYQESRPVVFWTASILDLFSFMIFGIMDPGDMIRPPLDHIVERIEAFVLVVLGFSIDNLVYNPLDNGHEEKFDDPKTLYTCFVLAFLIVFLVKLFHFDCEAIEEEFHALNSERAPQWGFAWMIVTGVVAMGISLLAPGLGVLMKNTVDDEDDFEGRKYFTIGLSIIMIGESLLRLCHDFTNAMEDFYGAKFLFWLQWSSQLFGGIILLVLDLKFKIGNMQLMISGVVILMVLVLFNLVDEFVEGHLTDGDDKFDELIQSSRGTSSPVQRLWTDGESPKVAKYSVNQPQRNSRRSTAL